MYILLYMMYKDMYVYSIHVYPTKMELKQRSPKPRNLGISHFCYFHLFSMNFGGWPSMYISVILV